MAQACDTEIQDFRLPAGVHEDVAGFEVAMDHAAFVGVLHGTADGDQEAQAGGDVRPFAF